MKLTKIKESPFCNTYGGLSLMQNDKGEKYLQMEDCFGPDIFGPLSHEQVDAFYDLCTVRPV